MEALDDVTTEAFINTRAFVAMRGNVCKLRCDQGIFLVGATNKLMEVLKGSEDESVKTLGYEFPMNHQQQVPLGGNPNLMLKADVVGMGSKRQVVDLDNYTSEESSKRLIREGKPAKSQVYLLCNYHIFFTIMNIVNEWPIFKPFVIYKAYRTIRHVKQNKSHNQSDKSVRQTLLNTFTTCTCTVVTCKIQCSLIPLNQILVYSH